MSACEGPSGGASEPEGLAHVESAFFDGNELTRVEVSSLDARFYSDGSRTLTWSARWQADGYEVGFDLEDESHQLLTTGFLRSSLSDANGVIELHQKDSTSKSYVRDGVVELELRTGEGRIVQVSGRTEGSNIPFRMDTVTDVFCWVSAGVVRNDDSTNKDLEPSMSDNEFTTAECQEVKAALDALGSE